MIADLIIRDAWRRQLIYVSLWGLLVAFLVDRLYLAPMVEGLAAQAEPGGMLALLAAHSAPPLMYFMPFTSLLKEAVLVATGITIILFQQQKQTGDEQLGEFLSLLLLAVSGMMFMISSDDLLMVFLSMEFIGIVSYILVGYMRNDLKAGEGAVKFYLIGAFSSAIMVYGMSFIYGLAGTTSIERLGHLIVTGALDGTTTLMRVGILLLLVGLGFKLAMVPFHSWLPDAMEGAPSAVAGFISVAPKAAGLVVVIRVFGEAFPLNRVEMVSVMSFLAMATMTFGNLMALHQRNVKRLLAYSSVAHIGYILVGVIAANHLGAGGVAIYVIAYIFMNLGAFACVIAVANRTGSEDIEDYAGLSQRNLPIAMLMIVFLLSLGGIPPTAGFIGKWYVFAAALKSMQSMSAEGGIPLHSVYLWLTVVGLLNSVVSIYYYLRVAYQMFFRDPRENTGIEGSGLLWVGTGFAAVMILVIGIVPQSFVQAALSAAGKLVIYQ